MYKKRSIFGSILKVILSIALILAIIILVVWLARKGIAARKNNTEFMNNLNKLQDVSKSYYYDKLPEKIGDVKVLTLKELYELGLIDNLKYGDTTCNSELSFVSVTKVAEDKYEIKSNLVCGSKTDIKSETVTKSELDKDYGMCQECCRRCNCCNQCGVIVKPKECKNVTSFQYTKNATVCPDGYTYNNSEKKCIKTTVDNKPSTKVYTSKNVTEDAKKNSDSTHKVYTNTTINTTTTKTYTNTLTNTTTTTSYANLVSNTTTTTSYANLVSNTTTTTSYANLTSNTTYNTVYTELMHSTETTYETTYVDAHKGYTPWGNPLRIYESDVKLYQTTECQKYAPNKPSDQCKIELTGTTVVWGVYTYTYALYVRDVIYTCEAGYVSGTKCVITTPVTTEVTTCPSGYTKTADGTQCYKTTSTTTYSCPAGYKKTSDGTKCYKETTSTTYSCPAGYTKTSDGKKCYKETSTTTYSCPTGYTKTSDGKKCYKNTTTTTYYCPTGFTSEGTGKNMKCYKNITTTTYSCPTGYTSEGTGKNMKCYKNVTTTGTYYCENANATLDGNKCTYTVVNTSYTCSDGYSLSTDQLSCTKTNVDKVAPTTKAVYVWSTANSKSGYTKTGKTKTVLECK